MNFKRSQNPAKSLSVGKYREILNPTEADFKSLEPGSYLMMSNAINKYKIEYFLKLEVIGSDIYKYGSQWVEFENLSREIVHPECQTVEESLKWRNSVEGVPVKIT